MPIFDYFCQKCKTIIEKYVPKADDKVYCHNCNNSILKRQIGTITRVKVLDDWELGKRSNFEMWHPDQKEPIALRRKGY